MPVIILLPASSRTEVKNFLSVSCSLAHHPTDQKRAHYLSALRAVYQSLPSQTHDYWAPTPIHGTKTGTHTHTHTQTQFQRKPELLHQGAIVPKQSQIKVENSQKCPQPLHVKLLMGKKLQQQMQRFFRQKKRNGNLFHHILCMIFFFSSPISMLATAQFSTLERRPPTTTTTTTKLLPSYFNLHPRWLMKCIIYVRVFLLRAY